MEKNKCRVTTKGLALFIGVLLASCVSSNNSNTPNDSQQTEPAKALFLAKIGNSYGFINKDKQLVVKPQFDYAKDFSEGWL